MKKTDRPLIKSANWALAGLLGLLGFSACENSEVMYGVPWASLAIKGTVVDKSTGNPIPDIFVKIVTPDNITSLEEYRIWNTVTAQDGTFKLLDTPSYEKITVVATDIDGEENGSFKPDTLYVDYQNAEHVGGGKGWFKGELLQTIKFEMETKKTDE